MMPATNFVQHALTPISTVSSSGGTNTTTAIQSGPYTKAQFLNTMEGSRSVKNIKEIEQLLRDYPAALELYRTKRYKVKVKYEADVERVILVEKRSSRNGSNNVTKTNDHEKNKQSNNDISTDVNKTKDDVKKPKDSDRSRSRTHSQDRVLPTTSVSENNDVVQTTTSSVRVASNAQPKVDHQRTPSKEREILEASQSKQEQQQQQQRQNSYHRERSHDSRSNASYSKQKARKSSRDYPTTIVPYIPNANPAENMWQQSRALQPYYTNPLFQQQTYPPNMYTPSNYVAQQNPIYQQPYYYPQQNPYSLTYQQQPAYSTAPQMKSTGNINNSTLHSAQHYPPSSQTMYNQNPGSNLPPSFHTFHPNQQQYQVPQAAVYPSQMPFQIPFSWPTTTQKPVGPVLNNNNTHVESRRSSKHRAHSVDTGPRGQPPANYYNQIQQQSAATITEHSRHHHHHHHHHRSYPTTVQVNNTSLVVEPAKEPNAPFNDPTTAAANNDNNGEKLTIRQLNEIFVQIDPSGRLPYSAVPPVLQRYGMSLVENDLTSAAQDLRYNVTEPISARRLVHVLVKLGKIAKSTQQQKPPQPLGSPSILPEDREVTDIMTQRRATGVTSTHIHSSAYPNLWY